MGSRYASKWFTGVIVDTVGMGERLYYVVEGVGIYAGKWAAIEAVDTNPETSIFDSREFVEAYIDYRQRQKFKD